MDISHGRRMDSPPTHPAASALPLPLPAGRPCLNPHAPLPP